VAIAHAHKLQPNALEGNLTNLLSRLIRRPATTKQARSPDSLDLLRFPLQGKLCKICRLPGNGIGWHVAIQGFKCKDTEGLFKKEKSQRFGAIRKVATRKLTMLEAATVLEDLKSPPGNRLEALVSDRAGQHSIRVNDQFRICFVWTDTGPTDVEITNHYA
jgi:proteic killer suppression protein